MQLQSTSGYHPLPSVSKDFELALKCLQDVQVFMRTKPTDITIYKTITFKHDLLQDMLKVIDWLCACTVECKNYAKS